MLKHTRTSLLICLLATVVFATGCSSLRITTDHADGVDFSAFETFKYRESETSLARSNQLVDQRIVEALRREMTASGLSEVESGADVFVTYYGSTSESIRLNTTHMGYGWPRGRWGGGMATSTTTATTHTQGTLVIDVWDSSSKELVWRGVVTDSISRNPDRNRERLNRGIVQAFEDFPPN